MQYRAYAKINLRLNIEKQLENSYHYMHMINAKIDFYDVIEFEKSNKNEVVFIPSINVSNNICLSVLDYFKKNYQTPHLKVIIHKNIPSGAGLGGGSSDAAVIINYLNNEFNLKISREKLIEIALQFGSDVPYCLFNEICYVYGTGEHIIPLNKKIEKELILINPNIFLSTKKVFSHVKSYSLFNKDNLLYLDDKHFGLLLHNDLENAAFIENECLKELKQELLIYGASLMSGSGSTFILIPKDDIDECLEILKKKYPTYLIIKTKIL